MYIANLGYRYAHIAELAAEWPQYDNVETAVIYDLTTGVRYGVATYAVTDDTVLLLRIYVCTIARRHGVGTQLIRAIDARYSQHRTRALVDKYDTEVLAAMLKLGFELDTRYVGVVHIDKYPPDPATGWFLRYVRNRKPVDFSVRHKQHSDFLECDYELDTL